MPVDVELAEELTARVAKAITDKDLGAFAELCTDDVVFIDPAFPAPFRGRQQVLAGLRAIFAAFPDLIYQTAGAPLISQADDTIATRVHFTGTMQGELDPPGFAPTHQPIDVHGVEIYTLAEDRIQRLELFLDTLELGRQIAAVPPEGSAGDWFGLMVQRLTAWRRRRQAA